MCARVGRHAIGLCALTIAGCTPDTSLKHRCNADHDCATGRLCTGGICVPRSAVDSSAVSDGGPPGETDGGPQADTRRLGRDRANIMFVTSELLELRFEPLEVADDRCNNAAAAAGLPGEYRAWISSSEVHARDRLGQARGWVRPDGLPFADTVDDIVNGRIFTPPLIDERGQAIVVPGAFDDQAAVATGTSSFGYNIPQENGNDWRRPNEPIGVGSAIGTTDRWTYYAGVSFEYGGRIYCFGVDQDFPVRPAPESGKRAFLSEAKFFPGGGIAAADGLCAAEAATAGLAGSLRRCPSQCARDRSVRRRSARHHIECDQHGPIRRAHKG
jgi:hypothetical protein